MSLENIFVVVSSSRPFPQPWNIPYVGTGMVVFLIENQGRCLFFFVFSKMEPSLLIMLGNILHFLLVVV